VKAPSPLLLGWQALRNGAGDRARIERFRDRALRRLVRHAYAAVPYYRELFDAAGLSPREIRTVADLAALPPSSKSELRERPLTDLLARGVDPEKLLVARTTGTTGTPFAVYRSRAERMAQRAFHLRALRSYGVSARDRVMLVVRPRGIRPALAERLLRRFGLLERPAYDMMRPPEEIAAALRRERPDVVVGIATILLEVARVAEQDGGPPIRPRLVMTSGELETPLMKRRLEEAFACPARNQYTSEEMSGMGAWECPRGGGFHVHDDAVVLELLDDPALPRPSDPEESSGEVVATVLHAYSMPVLRWRLGDLARRRPGLCACGAPFSTLQVVEGRRTDFFRLPGGRGIFSSLLVHRTYDHHEWMGQFQLEQVSLTEVVARVVPRRPPPPGAREALEAAMAEALGEGVDLRLELVDSVRLGAGGKGLAFWSRLDPWHPESPSPGQPPAQFLG